MNLSTQALKSSDDIGIVFVSSSLYGVFFVLFIISSFVLHRQSKWMKGTQCTSGRFGVSVYLGLGYLVFATVTSAWILSWVIVLKPTLSSVAKLHGEWSVPLYIQNTLGWFAVYFAEWNLIFRLYIIWQRKKAILWAALLVTLGYLAVTIREWIIYGRFRMVAPAGVTVTVILSICVNVIFTASIILKLWRQTRLSKAIGGWGIARLAAILIESAALYTTWMMIYLVLYWKKLPQSHLFLYGLPSVAGIATMLVNVRVGLGWAFGEEEKATHSLHNSAFAHSDEFLEDCSRTEGTCHSEMYQ